MRPFGRTHSDTNPYFSRQMGPLKARFFIRLVWAEGEVRAIAIRTRRRELAIIHLPVHKNQFIATADDVVVEHGGEPV